MCSVNLFPRSCVFRGFWIFLAVLAHAFLAHAEIGHVPPPRPEIDAGAPPLLRAPENARKPVELVPELVVSIPTCRTGAGSEHCAALFPALGAGLAALYRVNPYFAFGAAFSYSRASRELDDEGSLDGEMLDVGARGRVYLLESGAFDPYLELDLGYGTRKTRFASGARTLYEAGAYGATARVGGGLDFVVLPWLELGGAVGFTHLFLERGESCNAVDCEAGSAPGAAALGALALGLRATLLLGDPL